MQTIIKKQTDLLEKSGEQPAILLLELIQSFLHLLIFGIFLETHYACADSSADCKAYYEADPCTWVPYREPAEENNKQRARNHYSHEEQNVADDERHVLDQDIR